MLYNLPQSKIRPEFLADSVESYLSQKGLRLGKEERALIRRLSKEMQRSLPQELSGGEAFLFTLLATAPLLHLDYDFEAE